MSNIRVQKFYHDQMNEHEIWPSVERPEGRWTPLDRHLATKIAMQVVQMDQLPVNFLYNMVFQVLVAPVWLVYV